jgi:hypothetical protein
MADKHKGDKVTTPKFRMSFPALLVASAMKDDEGKEGEPKFSLVMLFDKAAQATPEFAKMKEIAKAAAIAKFGPDYKTKVPNLRSPFRDGMEKAQLEGYGEGVVFVSASTKSRPGVIDAAKRRIDSAEEIYPGRNARATVTAYAYDRRGNKGIAFGLHNVQLLNGGESLSGRVKAEDDFDEVEDAFDDDGLPNVEDDF